MITPRRLFELAGIPIPYILLIEGYKEATAEFSAVSPDAPAKIEAFRALVNKNQAIGDERNIDYWRKQGWEAFVAFIDSKSGPTKTALKRKKVVGQSITLREDDEWLIVIPLDKDASCFHGKNSDWCTTKYNQSHFERYFYDDEVVLIYCLNKNNGGMWAIAGHEKAMGKTEIFDQRDISITATELKAQTGLNAGELIRLALAQSKPIDGSRDTYKQALKDTEDRVEGGESGAEIEAIILKYKFQNLAVTYVKKHGNQASEEVQQLAVQRTAHVITYIKNPSEEVQKLAVQRNGWVIEDIKNPSDEVQKLAVQQEGLAIKHIKNPSEELQRLALQQDGDAIRYIENPSEEIQLFAVQRDWVALRYIKNPSEEVQRIAVQQNGQEIRRIANPSEQVQLIAIDQSRYAYLNIKNPTPAARALHDELWGQNQ
jgi:hypothetical protein